MNNHIIKQVNLDFNIRGKTNIPEIQQETKAWFDELMKGIEADWDMLATNDEFIPMDQMEIEISVNGSDWKEKALAETRRQIKDSILLRQKQITQEQTIKTLSPVRHFEEIFLIYLERGYLPWNTTESIKLTWKEQVQNLFKEPDTGFVFRIHQLLQKNPIALSRLYQEISVALILSIWQEISIHLTWEKKAEIKDVKQIETLLFWKKVPHEIGKAFWLWLLNDLLAKDESFVMKTFEVFLKRMTKNEFESMEMQVRDLVFQSKKMKEWQKVVLLKRKWQDGKRIDEFEKKESDIVKSKADIHLQNKDTLIKETKRANDSIYIDHAGIVLVAPFLPRFFEQLEFWKNGVLENKEAAAITLHFLATGNDSPEEFQLVLPKILCGIEVEQVIDLSAFQMTEPMKEESESLLASLIEHWGALGNASVGALRETFLQRSGRLTRNQTGWNLVVENKAFDVLLDRLPWNIAMIKLSWMPDMLHTEWDS